MKKTVTFHPSRIGCPSIPGTMKGIIMSLPGVEDVKVRYEDRSVDVSFDDGKISTDEIAAAIGKEMGLAVVPGETGGRQEGGAAISCPM